MNVKLPSDLPRLAPFIAVAVLALAGLVLVTRGSGGGGAGANANEVLQKAFAEGPRTTVMNVKAVITAEVAGAPDGTRGGTYRATGPVQQSTGRGQRDKANLKVTETGAGDDVSVRMLSTGTRGFVRAGGRWYQLTPQQFEQAFAAEAGGGQTVASDLGFNLDRWLQNPRIVGSATVDGTDTYDVTGDLDAAAMAADFEEQNASGSGAGEFDAFLRDAQKGGEVHVYVGKQDGFLRKADVTAAYTGQIANEATMRLTFRFDLGLRDIGAPQRFVAPKSALPAGRLTAVDPALLGPSLAADLGLTKGGASQGASGGGASKGSPAKDEQPARKRTGNRSRQAYINCVQQASDAAALEKCQALVPRR